MRGELAELGARAEQRFQHLVQDVEPAFARLVERDAHDLLGDAGDLDVHLQGVTPCSVPATLKSMSPVGPRRRGCRRARRSRCPP